MLWWMQHDLRQHGSFPGKDSVPVQLSATPMALRGCRPRGAADMRMASDAEAAREEDELTGREAALRDVLGRLDEAQTG